MQKIQSYLYPNRIQVVLNLASTLLEWRIVYQRPIKIYQGLDNVIELDVKNLDQKRVDIAEFNLKFLILDQLGQEIYETSVDTSTGVRGVGRVIIPAAAIGYIKPQFLKYTVYLVNNDSTKTPIYGDTQFGMSGTIDLIGGALSQPLPEKIIDTFTYLIDDSNPSNYVKTYFSEAVEINPLNDINENSSINLEFRNKGLEASVTVQFTDDAVICFTTNWRDIETFSLASSTETLVKTYNEIADYSNNVGWLRIKYIPWQGTDATFKIKKENGSYDVTLEKSGNSYRIGNEIKILGSQLGGDDGANDLVITVTGLNMYPRGGIQHGGFTFSGIAFDDPVNDPMTFQNVQGITEHSTGKFDKIIVRM